MGTQLVFQDSRFHIVDFQSVVIVRQCKVIQQLHRRVDPLRLVTLVISRICACDEDELTLGHELQNDRKYLYNFTSHPDASCFVWIRWNNYSAQ
jgi:hypothetical protein